MKRTGRISRTQWVLLLTMGLGVGLMSFTTDAHAKSNRIAMTGVRSFDKVFKKARRTDERIRSARSNIRLSKASLTKALSLGHRSTYVEALKELERRARGKLRVAVRNGAPRLEPKRSGSGSNPAHQSRRDIPRNVEAGMNAVNQLLDSIPESIRDMKAASKEARGMANKAKSFPRNIRKELMSTGMDGWVALILKSPKISKKVVRNIKLISKMPGRASSVTNDMAAITSAVRKTFK